MRLNVVVRPNDDRDRIHRIHRIHLLPHSTERDLVETTLTPTPVSVAAAHPTSPFLTPTGHGHPTHFHPLCPTHSKSTCFRFSLLGSDVLALCSSFLSDEDTIHLWVSSAELWRTKFMDKVALKKRYTSQDIESFVSKEMETDSTFFGKIPGPLPPRLHTLKLGLRSIDGPHTATRLIKSDHISGQIQSTCGSITSPIFITATHIW